MKKTSLVLILTIVFQIFSLQSPAIQAQEKDGCYWVNSRGNQAGTYSLSDDCGLSELGKKWSINNAQENYHSSHIAYKNFVSISKYIINTRETKQMLFDSDTGKVLVDFMDIMSPGFVYHNGKLYSFGFNKTNRTYESIFCFDSESGQKIWQKESKSMTSYEPIITGNKLLCFSKEILKCHDLASGDLLWVKYMPAPIGSGAVFNNQLFIVTQNCSIFLLSPDDGETQFEITNDFETKKDYPVSISILDGLIFLNYTSDLNRSNLYCFDIETQKKLWNIESEQYESFNQPSIRNGKIYILERQQVKGNVKCLDSKSGEEIWNTNISQKPIYLCKNNILVDNKLIVAYGYKLCIMDTENGEILKKIQFPSQITNMLFCKNKLFVNHTQGVECFSSQSERCFDVYPLVHDLNNHFIDRKYELDETITSCSTNEIEVEISSKDTCIKIEENKFKLQPGDSKKIKILFDTNGLQSGVLFKATIQVFAGDLSRDIIINTILKKADETISNGCFWPSKSGLFDGAYSVPNECGSKSALEKFWSVDKDTSETPNIEFENRYALLATREPFWDVTGQTTYFLLDGRKLTYLDHSNSTPFVYGKNSLLTVLGGALSGGPYLCAFEAQGNKELWHLPVKTMASPVVEGDYAYCANGKSLNCVDITKGDMIWGVQFEDNISCSPLLDDGKVYVLTNDSQVHVVDIKTEEIVKSHKIEIKPEQKEYMSLSSVDNGKLVLVEMNYEGGFRCMDMDNGNQLWKMAFGDDVSTYFSRENGKLYFIKFDKKTAYAKCVNTVDRKEIWSVKLGDNIESVSVNGVLCGDRIFFGTNDMVTCLSTSDGLKLYARKASGNIRGMILGEGCLLVDCATKLDCFKASFNNCIEIDPEFIDFGAVSKGEKKDATVNIRNCSEKKISITLQNPKPYIELSSKRLEIEPGATTQLKVTIDSGKIEEKGMITAQVVLSLGTSYKKLDVRIYVKEENIAKPDECEWFTSRKDFTNNASAGGNCTPKSINLSTSWKRSFGDRNENLDMSSQPVLINGRCYVAGRKELWCVDANDGKLLWSKKMETGCNGLVAFKDMLFYTTYDKTDTIVVPSGNLVACDLDGKVLWEEKKAGFGQLPIVDEKMVVYFCEKGLRCSLRTNGKNLWTKDDISPITANEMAKVGNMIYVYTGSDPFGSGDTVLNCIDIFTGEKKWSKVITASITGIFEYISGIKPFVVAYENELWIADEKFSIEEGSNISLFQIDPISGKILNRFGMGELGIDEISVPIVTKEHVFARYNYDDFACLEKKTGKLLWKARIYNDGINKNSEFSSVEIGGKNYILGGITSSQDEYYGDPVFSCLDSKGKIIWSLSGKEGFTCTPVAYNNKIYVSTTENLYCFDAIQQGATNTLTFTIGKQLLTRDEFKYQMDAPPKVISGRTYIPAKYVVEPLDGNVAWDQKEKRVTCTLDKKIVVMWIGKDKAIVDGKEVKIDAKLGKPLLDSGRVMVPLRFLAQSLGLSLEYDAKSKTIKLATEKSIP